MESSTGSPLAELLALAKEVRHGAWPPALLRLVGRVAASGPPLNGRSPAALALAGLLVDPALRCAEALTAGFEALARLLDGSPVVERALLDAPLRKALFDRANVLGMRESVDFPPGAAERLFPQLYFSTSVVGRLMRAQGLCVDVLAPLCLKAAGVGDGNVHVLDFGCGPATWTLPLARALGESGTLTCVEADRTALSVTEHLVAKAGLGSRVRYALVETDFAALERFLDRAGAFDVVFMCDVVRYLAYARRELWSCPHEAFLRANAGYWRRFRTRLRGSRAGVHVISLEKPDLAGALRDIMPTFGFRDVTSEAREAGRLPELGRFPVWPPHVLQLWARDDAADMGVADGRGSSDTALPNSAFPPGLAALPPATCLP